MPASPPSGVDLDATRQRLQFDASIGLEGLPSWRALPGSTHGPVTALAGGLLTHTCSTTATGTGEAVEATSAANLAPPARDKPRLALRFRRPVTFSRSRECAAIGFVVLCVLVACGFVSLFLGIFFWQLQRWLPQYGAMLFARQPATGMPDSMAVVFAGCQLYVKGRSVFHYLAPWASTAFFSVYVLMTVCLFVWLVGTVVYGIVWVLLRVLQRQSRRWQPDGPGAPPFDFTAGELRWRLRRRTDGPLDLALWLPRVFAGRTADLHALLIHVSAPLATMLAV
jgi:hypothetical protein